MLGLWMLALPSSFAAAADCPGNPTALGTGRVLAIDPATTAPLGRKHFPATLPVGRAGPGPAFDGGPCPLSRDRVLAALRHECVRATFFLLGRNAKAHPALARRALAEGHSIGHHTYSHPLLNRMPLERAEAEIDRGIGAVDSALHGAANGTSKKAPDTPFFRFPGFASNPALLERLARRNIVVFGADLWASDWDPMTPEHQRELLLKRLANAGGGIVLLHDTHSQTAAMLPEFLRELKRRGYRVVHVVPAGATARAQLPATGGGSGVRP